MSIKLNHINIRGLLAAAAIALISLPALALDLDSARSSGVVIENADGYISAASANSSADVRSFVSTVNAARKEEYQRVAAKNGQPLDVVEKLAAAKIQQKLKGGM
jgi:uncharacterized protein YdbL (DUF1318 family)